MVLNSDLKKSSYKCSSMSGGRKKIELGIQRLCNEKVNLIKGMRLGLICNQASVDHKFQHSADILKNLEDVDLTALFGPQHGIRGEVQDNMIETPHTIDKYTGLPIYSLYSETREPTEEMLEDLDAIIFDMQDVGCRIYTFIYTLANCMRAARKYDKKIIVCDRPNPINGLSVEGNLLEAGFESFVGQFPLPTRHGLTVTELAKMFNEHWGINCELEIVTMNGWERDYWFDQTDAPWVMPSPNMPTVETATVFPGTVHLEGTQISEGRGTTRPFELVGAPYIDARELEKRLKSFGLSGVEFREAYFLPTFQKHSGEICGGVQVHVTDRDVLEPVITGVAIIKAIWELYGRNFKWKKPPYEYVYDKNPFDVIAGTDKLRKAIESGKSLDDIKESWADDLNNFKLLRDKYITY